MCIRDRQSLYKLNSFLHQFKHKPVTKYNHSRTISLLVYFIGMFIQRTLAWALIFLVFRLFEVHEVLKHYTCLILWRNVTAADVYWMVVENKAMIYFTQNSGYKLSYNSYCLQRRHPPLAARGDLVVPHIRPIWWRLGNRAFCVAGPIAWNSLPSDIRTASSLTTFKNLPKWRIILFILSYYST